MRNRRGPTGGGRGADVDAVAAQIWQRHRGTGDINYADARNAALRVIRAQNIGDALRGESEGVPGPLARAYPFDPTINRSRGNYRYRSVVRGEGAGQRFEMVVDVYSRNRLTEAEIIRRSERAFMRGEGAHNNYRNRVAELGPAPTIQTFVLFGYHSPADRD